MGKLRFSLMQIEAFTCVCEAGNFTLAAKRLKKDRTTIRELVEYLELDLGYLLFDRQTRPLQLSPAGKKLYRQARLFLQEAEAFGILAEQIPQQVNQSYTLCYDPFTPRQFLANLVVELHQQNIQLNLLMMERIDAENALENGIADIAIYQAINRSISEKFKWRAIGSIEFAVYANDDFFPSVTPLPLITLASKCQIIPFRDLPESISKRLQISDHIQIINEISLLQSMLASGLGWAFLPTHLQPTLLPKIKIWDTELGHQGLLHPMVALWKPGPNNGLLNIINQLQQI
ncbi:LysR family transcriptional regulator [Providencia burhodogranariea]|uniref:Regulatory protein LysR n=1 Tax=Providencia burhodogranariea DSM 19968 TaxID=1141662 RepID=K8WRB9_9GAMM|nr:LysR family transcriptional regulator [Providencia burhodogranariea]EKT62501.1 regulatory protein LysR [Providencia burhodogranariea DSM 19968]